MGLVILLYMLLATTFTFGKAVLYYTQPIFFIGIRMLAGGSMLLGYWLYRKRQVSIKKEHFSLFARIILFHIYLAFILEFWGMQYVSSAKTCLLYNMAPFITAIFAYLLWKERLSYQKIAGLVLGFAGFLPVLLEVTGEQTSSLVFLSTAELAILFGVAAAAYGWILMKQLIHHGYKPVFVNGIGMFFGGGLALVTSFVAEQGPRIFLPAQSVDPQSYLYGIERFVMATVPASCVSVVLFSIYTLALILIANIGCYNLYGYLLHTYSATFLSFAGFTCPFFAALFGWLFLHEALTWGFVASNLFVFMGLYVFYQGELKVLRGRRG